MHTFKAAQPALLYLSPACILSVLVTGLAKGQLNTVFEYSSKDDDKKKDDHTKSDSAKKSKNSEKKRKKKTSKPSPVVKTESSSEGVGDEDANKLKPSDNGDGPGAVTGEEDYVEVTSTRKRKSKRAQRKAVDA